MKFAAALPGIALYPPITQPWERTMGPADFQLVARTIEELGFDSIAVPEHIVMPTELADLMGSTWPHAWTVMAFVAGATTRITVDSSVIVLPHHDPIVLAKAVSTLDVLSGGRVRLTIGVGHAQREFEILRTPFRERGRMTDEYLAVMKELWTADRPVFHGEYVQLDDVVFEPKPVQVPHPPIWVGGNSGAAMRRSVRHEGWYPWLITIADLPRHMSYVRSLPAFHDRSRPFDVCVPLVPPSVDEEHRPRADPTARVRPLRSAEDYVDSIGRLEDIGVTWTTVPTPRSRSLEEHLDGLRWIASDVIPACR